MIWPEKRKETSPLSAGYCQDVVFLVNVAVVRLHTALHKVLQVASALAALTHPSHVLMYAPGGALPCRLDPTRMTLCICINLFAKVDNNVAEID